MLRKHLLFILGLLSVLALSAILVLDVSATPAAPIEHELTQPDGSTFQAWQWGDEWSNGYETLDGYTIIQDEFGWWVYAKIGDDGHLMPVFKNGEKIPATHLPPQGVTKNIRPVLTQSDLLLPHSSIDTPNIGNQPTLVLLASFSDRSNTYSAASFATLMFGTSNSVKDFYSDASFSQLTLTPATETHGTTNDGVVGWFNLGYNHPNTGTGWTVANQLIVKNVLNAADSYVNFATYDNNPTDGYISLNELHLVVVVAGYERSYSNTSPSIWAHRFYFYDTTPPTLDGKILGDPNHNGGYAQLGEIHLDHQATIGIIIHELGHDLTWPDLYDTDGSSDGVGQWSIMGSGNWNYTGTNYPGTSPAFPDAWLKWYQGWITPTVVTGTITNASIPQAETNATAYLLRPNPGGVDWEWMQYSGSGEYFLVENRQLTGYDAGLPGAGLNILHVDEGVTYFNSANANEYHPLIKFMQADGLDELLYGDSYNYERGDNGDPFPGVTNNRTFNYSSNPNSRLYSGADSLTSVTSISNSMATMTATLSYTGPINQPPIANAGMDQVVFTNLLVSLDGSLSLDPDFNYPLTYAWTQLSGPGVSLNDPTSVTPSFTAPSDPAILVFSLIVTDNLGLSSTPDTIQVTVLNQPPIANAGPDQSVNTMALVTLDGSGTYDPDGDLPLSYVWLQIAGPGVVLSNPNAVNPTFVAPLTPSTITFNLHVTDFLGATAVPDSVSITILNQAPVADAGQDQLMPTMSMVFLDGSLSHDPEGHSLSFAWTQTAGPTVSLINPSTPNPSFVAPSDPASIAFSLVVTDSFGAPSAPDSVTITIFNQLPIAEAGPDQSVIYFSTVTLDGTASTDPDGDLPLTFLWTQTGGTNVTLDDPNLASPSFTAPGIQGTLTFSLVVTDAWGDSSSPDMVYVMVSGFNLFLPMIIK